MCQTSPLPGNRAFLERARRLLPLIPLASIGACAPQLASRADAGLRPTGFPTSCAPNEVQVMLLGTYHMANPGLDAVKSHVDDVLVPARQRQLEELANRLASWQPDQIAVEGRFADSTYWRRRYDRYVSGTDSADRNEIVQIGFRLAKQLGHSAVYPIDFQMIIGNDSVGAVFERRPELRAIGEALTAQMQRHADSAAPTLLTRTVVDLHREANTDASLHSGNSAGMFGSLMPVGEGNNYGGPQVLAKWYERNIRMVHHLHRVKQPSTKRMLVIVGSGHVPPMRNILDEDPGFCPVSPLPLLSH